MFLRIARKSILFEQKTQTKTFEIVRKKIDFTPFSLVFRPTLVVKIKKTQESTREPTRIKENIILLPFD